MLQASPIEQERQQLRRAARLKRANIPPQDKQRLAQLTCQHLLSARLWRARHIALYWPLPMEISPLPLMRSLAKRGCHLYLPVLPSKPLTRMQFIRYHLGEPLSKTRFGFLQPQYGHRVGAKRLQAIILPLVAFDLQGNRLGQGKGFYDQTLANNQLPMQRIGLAFDEQKVNIIPTERWDIPLHWVLTPTRLYRCKQMGLLQS